MSEGRNRAAIDKLVTAINDADMNVMNTVFTEDVVTEWPQSGERIRGEENRRAIYSRMPGLPAHQLLLLSSLGDTACPHTTSRRPKQQRHAETS